MRIYLRTADEKKDTICSFVCGVVPTIGSIIKIKQKNKSYRVIDHPEYVVFHDDEVFIYVPVIDRGNQILCNCL